MVSGRLAVSRGRFYAVLYWRDPETGKKTEKWISTRLRSKGNSTRAKNLMTVLKYEFDPYDVRKTNQCLLRLGLNPVSEDCRKMNRGEARKFIDAQSRTDPSIAIAHNRIDGRILFSDYMRIWLARIRAGVRPTTFTGYQYNVERVICPYFGIRKIRLDELTPDDIEDFYHDMMKEKNPNTVIRYHANIRKALQYAFKKGLLPNNPADRVDRPRAAVFMHSFYNKEETVRLLEKVKGTPFEFPVTMCAYYGLRREEVVGLRWDAIDFQYKQLTIKHTVTEAVVDGKRVEIAQDTTKTKKSFRTLPFDPAGHIENLLLDMRERQEQWKKVFGRDYNHGFDDYIYVRENGDRYKVNWLSENFKRFLRQNGLREIRFHDLRHTCATMLRHTGVPMEDIQKFLGHSTITTTEGIYAHFDDTQHKSTITRLSNYLSDVTTEDNVGKVIHKEEIVDSIKAFLTGGKLH